MMKSCALAARAARSICSSRELLGRRVRDVVAHGVVEEHGVLADDAGQRAKRRERDVARVDPVYTNPARGRIIKAGNEIDERALPRSAGADERDDRAFRRAGT